MSFFMQLNKLITRDYFPRLLWRKLPFVIVGDYLDYIDYKNVYHIRNNNATYTFYYICA